MNTPLLARHSTRRKFYPSRPFVVLLVSYLIGMFLFTALRLLFYSRYTELSAQEPFQAIATAFLIGLRFDQIIVLSILAVPLLLLPWLKLDKPAARRSFTAFTTGLFSLCFLLLLADIRFYHFFDSRLSFLAVEYIGEGSLFTNLVVSDPEFYPLLFIWMVLTVIFLLAVLATIRFTRAVVHRRSWLNQIVYLALSLALFALGIRGRVNLAPMDWGVAYFSDNNFLNQLALNGVYTLSRNFTEANQDPRLVYLPDNERFPLAPTGEALSTVRSMLQADNEEWLQPDSSLLRVTHQQPSPFGFRPNIVIILSESWSAEHTGTLGSPRPLTPNFDRLANSGLLFTNFYASGIRTNYGISAVFGSFPALPGRAIMKRYNARHPFIALSEILYERGYTNAFVYGGDMAFDNMEGFLREKKFELFYGESHFDRRLSFSKWGIPDHVLFEKAAGLTDSLPRPFQLTILTLSNHEPWDLPDSSVQLYFDSEDSSKVFNSQRYADFALGRFFDSLSRCPVFDSTIFVFVSDHARYGPSRFLADTKFFHVPLLIYCPALLGNSGRRYDVIGSQTDILPTLMGLLGDSYTHASWGRDLLHLPEGDSGFAVMNVGSRVAYLDRSFFYVEDLIGLVGFGSRDPGAAPYAWFGQGYLRSLDVLGRPYTSDRWNRTYLNMLTEPERFSTTAALAAISVNDLGYFYMQGIGGRADTTDIETTSSWQSLFGDTEPQGMKWSRKRLRHFVQAADQLSTPAEPESTE